MRVRKHYEGSLLYKKDAGRVNIGWKYSVGVGMSDRKPDNVPIYMKQLTKRSY